MAVNVSKYRTFSSTLISMLLPFFLKGKKVVRFLSAIASPIDDVNLVFTQWARERIIDAVTTSQPLVLEWALNEHFRHYFKDVSDSFEIIPYGFDHYLAIYENQTELDNTEDADSSWMLDSLADTTEIDTTLQMVIMDKDEVKRENDNFIVVAPPIRNLLSDAEYTRRIKQVIENYLVYPVTYKIHVRTEIN